MKRKLFLLSFFAATILAFTVVNSNVPAASAATVASEKTGVGLSEHALRAYQEKWQYRSGCYGQLVNGRRATDCSGLVKSYLWWTGDKTNPSSGSVSVAGSSGAMLKSAKVSGTIKYSSSSSLPRVHGLILYQPGHVGVYVGNNMAIDNRESGVDIKYEKVFGRSSPKWTNWFKLPQITYPTTGLLTFDGKKYYYESGQYIVNADKLIDGVPYHFDSAGVGAAL